MDESEFRKFLGQLEDHEKRLKSLEDKQILSALPSSTVNQVKKMSLKEFLLSKEISDDVKKTLAIAYFLERFENFESFSVNDLLNYYERAKEKKPLNINDKVNMNIKNGHMDLAREKKYSKKSWYVTSSGEAYVEANFKTDENNSKKNK